MFFLRHHSLWAEFVYNAARVIADIFDSKQIECKSKNCLELGLYTYIYIYIEIWIIHVKHKITIGAGAGLPSLIAALNGAKSVVITDYGTSSDRSLITAIDMNVEMIKSFISDSVNIIGIPYIWGYDTSILSEPIEGGKFDLVIMADCIFNRSEHRKLLKTLSESIDTNGIG